MVKKNRTTVKPQILTRNNSLRLFLLDPCGFLQRGQGVLLLLEGSLRILEGRDLFLKSPGERGDSRPLTLELGLLALELGLLRFEGLLLLLERFSSLL